MHRVYEVAIVGCFQWRSC